MEQSRLHIMPKEVNSSINRVLRVLLKEIVALVGVAPMNRESGNYQGKRRIRGGCPRIRTVMFMAMMSAIQCNPVFKRYYTHLKASGKLPKVALIACMRKLIVILNTMVKNEERWSSEIV